jgi:hypothetical protein
LASDDVRTTDVISWLALIGQDTASDRGGMGGAYPTKLNLREGGAGVIWLHLCIDERKNIRGVD